MTTLELLATCLGITSASLIVLAAWLAGARCPHCRRNATVRPATPAPLHRQAPRVYASAR